MAAGEVTRLLKVWCQGDASALERLAPLVESELRRIARQHLRKEGPGGTLQPTALINEAYLRLIEWNAVEWRDRAHFYSVAAKMMRRILVNQAIAGRTRKRGGSVVLVSLTEAGGVSDRTEDLAALDEAMAALSRIDPRKSELVELRFFGGLTAEENSGSFGHILAYRPSRVGPRARVAVPGNASRAIAAPRKESIVRSKHQAGWNLENEQVAIIRRLSNLGQPTK